MKKIFWVVDAALSEKVSDAMERHRLCPSDGLYPAFPLRFGHRLTVISTGLLESLSLSSIVVGR
jgi:hypothetical protein